MSHSLYYIIGGCVQNVLALLFAIILNDKRVMGRKVFRGIIFLPFILNGTSVSFMFRYFYNFDKGPLNIALRALGLDPVSWLGNESIVNWALAFVCLWRFTGYIMVIYLAALQSIPAEHYEAATIDGANSRQKLIFVTLPQIKTIIGLQMFLNISGAINIFDIPFVITRGKPECASQTLAIQAIDYALHIRITALLQHTACSCTVTIIVFLCSAEQGVLSERMVINMGKKFGKGIGLIEVFRHPADVFYHHSAYSDFYTGFTQNEYGVCTDDFIPAAGSLLTLKIINRFLSKVTCRRHIRIR